MAGNTKIDQEPTEMAKNTNSCSECGSEINEEMEMCPSCGAKQPGISQNSSSSDKINNDQIANGLLRLCAIINGTWDNILTSIQSISFLREVALYIDCSILAIWKHKNQTETTEITKFCSECGSEINEEMEMCPSCGAKQPGISQNSSSSDKINNDQIANGLLRLCAIINGTWDNILTSIQSISFLREVALYIDCSILAIWKHKNQTETTEITKFCSECGSRIGENTEICPECGMGVVRKRS